MFGMKDEKDVNSMLRIANVIHKAVPEGSDGGQVLAAMTVLIGAGALYGINPEDHDVLKEHVMLLLDDVLEGRIRISFEKEH